MGSLPSFRLEGQVALVTGTARGLGRAIAIALAEAGADVALGLRDSSQRADVVEAIEACGRRDLPLQMNMADLNQVRKAIEAAAARTFQCIPVNASSSGLVRYEPP